MKDDKTKQILRSIQTIASLADLILIEYQMCLVGKPFARPVLNQKAKRIKQDAQDILRELGALVVVKNTEEVENHALQLHRLMSFFSTMAVNQMESYLDALEKLPSVDITDTVQILDQ